MSSDPKLVARVSNDFTYHAPPVAVRHTFKELRDLAKDLALKIAEVVPAGREQSSALTRLEEAIFHANAGIAGQFPAEVLPTVPTPGAFRKKPVVITAITFDELIDHARKQGAHEIAGMPWSFTYAGQHITHENDDCYLIPTLEGTMKFQRGDMLITGVKGEIYPCKSDIFTATYDPA
jgi:hypothetical protein